MFHPSDGNVRARLSPLSRASEELGFLRKGSYFKEANTTLQTSELMVALGLCLGSQSFLRDLAHLRMDAGWGTLGRLPPPGYRRPSPLPFMSSLTWWAHLSLLLQTRPRATLPSRKTLSSPFLHPSGPFYFLPNMSQSASDRGAPFQVCSLVVDRLLQLERSSGEEEQFSVFYFAPLYSQNLAQGLEPNRCSVNSRGRREWDSVGTVPVKTQAGSEIPADRQKAWDPQWGQREFWLQEAAFSRLFSLPDRIPPGAS